MKRLFTFILGVIFIVVPFFCHAADQKVYYLSLGAVISGNTSDSKGAGTSVFAVTSGYDIPRSGASVIQVANTEGEYYVVQITGVTVSQGQLGAGGTYSGNTITLRYRETPRNEKMFWDLAQPIDLINGLALSGNTFYPIQIYPTAFGFIRFESLLSGVTPLDGFTFEFHVK